MRSRQRASHDLLRFRPHLERLEDRALPGDTILGLSAVAWLSLGFTSDALPWVVDPATLDRAWPHGLFASLEATDCLTPAELATADTADATIDARIVAAALDGGMNGFLLLSLPSAVPAAGAYRLTSSEPPLSHALSAGVDLTGAMPGLDSSGLSFALAGIGAPAGRSGGSVAAPGAAAALSFDGSSGWLTIRESGGEHTVRERVAADGFVDVVLDGQHHSSNPSSTAFDSALAGATGATVAGIRFAGSGQDTLTLGSQHLASSLTVQASGATVITENVATAGRLTVQAPNITVNGRLQASSVALTTSGWVNVNAAGSIDAIPSERRVGRVSPLLAIDIAADVFVSAGQLHADAPAGGQITIQAGNILNAGPITADSSGPGSSAGQVNIAFTDSYVATTAAVMSASGVAGPGGRLTIDGGLTGHLFTSGRHLATGSMGGTVDLFGRDIVLAGALIDGSGEAGGGSVHVGGNFQDRSPDALNTQTVTVTPSSTIRADARRAGAGGQVFVWADQTTVFDGAVSARGGPDRGPGGLVDVSGHGDLSYGGSADAGARLGKSGTLLLDPKNITISDAPAGVFPQLDLLDPHPTPGGSFGTTNYGPNVLALSNGNVVVINEADDFGGSDAGAVYLFDGLSGALLSSLIGSHPNDQLGGPVRDVISLTNGNFVVASVKWNNGRGAVTWGSSRTGVSGVVSEANSLVGTDPRDAVGSGNDLHFVPGLYRLNNGNYLVDSPFWGGTQGAVTWGNGNTGVSGTVSEANSLVGSNPQDEVGQSITFLTQGNYVVESMYGATWGNENTGISGTISVANTLLGGQYVVPLSNGNYVVGDPNWGSLRGAVTWGNGSTGISGTISDANSLVGGNPGDFVGGSSRDIIPLSNGNYLVESPDWNKTDGAVTWGNGSTGTSGIVSEANSLVGSNPGDFRLINITLLKNGNYLVGNVEWNGRRGAVTWGSGSTGVSGTISATNSLVGRNPNDYVGSNYYGILPLSNGNYVVVSQGWNQGRGAVTWGNGNTGVSGIVSDANSLVGSNPSDFVGGEVYVQPRPPIQYIIGGVFALTNGNYLVESPKWNNDRGAVTLGNGSTGTNGIVSDADSVVGSDPGDEVWASQLPNGNFVAGSPSWNDNRGAVSWFDGTTGTVPNANSLLGSNPGDRIGSRFAFVLSNGNFVVDSPNWNGNRGAVTWINGAPGGSNTVSEANSLVGSSPGDQVGNGGVFLVGNSNYVVDSPNWNGNRGAVTWVNGNIGLSGNVLDANSLTGSNPGDGVGGSVAVLSNGNYVVTSPLWNSSRGAATWGNGNTGTSGVVSEANSLVGGSANDQVGYAGIARLANGNYLVFSPYWNGSFGAVTWGNGSTGVSGIVSEANSLVGSNTYDHVGSLNGAYSGLILLSNGNYVVVSPDWDSQSGALTWGSGSAGVSGIVSDANSFVGSSPGDLSGNSVHLLSTGNYLVTSRNGGTDAVAWVDSATGQTLDGLGYFTPQNSLVGGYVAQDPAHQSFLTVGSGRVAVGLPDPNQFSYARGQAQTVTLTPDFLTRTLDSGTAVVLQASDDITVNSPITVSAGGQGGALTLEAGRSIVLNANITTDNGALTLIANDQLANGVIDSERDPGPAVITMAPGTTLDTGLGALTVELRDGVGRSNRDSGAITLQTVTAGSISVVNNGPSPGSDVNLGFVTTTGLQTYANPNGTATVAGNLTATDNPITFSDSVVLNAGITLGAGSNNVDFAEGTVTPSPGAVTIAGGVVLNRSATLSATLNGTDPGSYSQLAASGLIDLGGSTLSLTLGFAPPVGSSFEILTNTGSAPINGNFNGLTEGAAFTQGGYQFQITYHGGTGGNSVLLTRLA